MIAKNFLLKRYVKQGLSVHTIAQELGCSDNKVTYWLQKHSISKRTISEAVYLKNNPNGDPFTFIKPKSSAESFLYGLGLGLFWGEGNKVDKHSVRLGNTDPDLILMFLKFLHNVYQIDERKLTFGLQIFSDIDEAEALRYWTEKLQVKKDRFQKVVSTRSSRKGTYKQKNRHGVLTIYFSNMKLRDSIVGAINELRTAK